MENFKIFCGNASAELAAAIARHLGVSLGKIEVGRFSDGETRVEIVENVRGKEVFIVQSTCSPANDNLMELVAMADAFRRASAGLVTAVIPYFGYARQDRRVRSARVPVTAKVVADILASVGINRVITVDLHADQIQGFFCMPVDNVYASQILLSPKDLRASPMIVSPDVGGVVRARAIAKTLSTELAIIDKRRPEPGKAEVMHVIGDVSGKNCIIVDDMVDTAGTLCQAALALKNHGAETVTACCTHPVLSGKAIENVKNSVLDALVVSDSIPLSVAARECKKIRPVSISGLLAEAIYRIKEKKSLSEMFS